MAITRIKNNQITDTTITGAKIVSNTITAGLIENDLTYGSNLTVSGNLTVNGTTHTINTTNTSIEDPIIRLASQASGAGTVDIGFLGERGTDTNIAFVWDESADAFVAGFTNDADSSTTVTFTAKADLQVAGLTTTGTTTLASLSVTPGATNLVVLNATGLASLDGGIDVDGVFTVADGTGNISTSGTLGAGNTTVGTLDATGLASLDGGIDVDGIFTVGDGTGNVSTTGTLGAGNTIITGTLDATALASLDGGIDVDGVFTVADATGNIDTTGTLDVDGISTLGVINATGLASLDGGIDVDGIFTVGDGTGNISTTGTLGAGASTLSSATISNLTDNRIIIAGTAGVLEDDGNLTFDGTTFEVGTSFDVISASGNTAIGGTLDVTGLASLDGGIDVDAAFTVADTTGNIATTGNLDVITGVTTLSNLVIAEETTTAGSFAVSTTYEIVTAGTTDFTLIGSANSDVGTIFTASGAGTGTGTAKLASVIDAGANRITDVADPTLAQDAATMNYVDTNLALLAFDMTDGSNTEEIAGGATITFNGTANEITTLVSATDTLTIGLPNDVTIGNNLTVTGNMGAATIGVSGISTMGVINASGLASLDGGIDVDGAFTVADGSGNVSTTGTFNADGLSTLGAITIDATSTLNMGGNVLTNAGDGVANTDLVTKQQLDAAQAGILVKEQCNVATDAALPAVTAAGAGVGKTLTADAVGILTVDGVATVLNDRILIKDQVNQVDNGIYDVTTEGTAGVAFILTRATDYDGNPSAEVQEGTFTFIENGTANVKSGWVLLDDANFTAGVANVDTALNELVFAQFQGLPAYTGGTNIDISGQSISVSPQGAASGLDADLLDAQHGAYYLDHTNFTNVPDPVITLDGDASGSVTLTNLTSGTLTVTVADDSHNHIIANVDGLQTALDGKLNDTSDTVTGTLTIDTGGTILWATAPTAGSHLTNRDYVDGLYNTGWDLFDGTTTQTIAGGNTLTINGTTNEVEAVVTATDTLTIGLPNDVTIAASLTVTTGLAANGGITVDSTAFIVADSTGNVTTAGTLDVAGVASLDGGIDVDGAFTVTDGTGAIATTGTLTVTSDTTTLSHLVITEENLAATALSAATSYEIVTIGTTDFTAIGAASNTVGLIFTASGAGTGTGTAKLASTIDAGDNRIANVTDPVLDQDAATKLYVDSASAAGWTIDDGSTSQVIEGGGTLTINGTTNEIDAVVTATDTLTIGLPNDVTIAGILTVSGQANIDNVTINGNDITATSGELTINEAGADINFRVEGDTDTNLLFIDAGTDSVNIGTATAQTDVKFQIGTTDSMIAPSGTTAERPSVGIGGMFRYNSTINEYEYFDGTSWKSFGEEFTVIASETFVGTGAQTVYTLGTTQTTASCIVSINGVIQIPTTAYAVSGTTLTFTEAPANTDDIEVREITTTTSIVEVTNGNSSLLSVGSTFDLTGSIVPTVNNTYDLGSGSNKMATVYATTFSGEATSAQYADLAENYTADTEIAPGTVVCFGGTAEVTTCNTDADTRVAGIVSTNPAYLMNSELDGVAVALRGRVPCKVSGSIKKGDMLVSDGNGGARAEANPVLGSVLAKALEDSEGDAVIEVVV